MYLLAGSEITTPLTLLKSGQLLALTPDCPGALFLQKAFYTEFVGPGAAVGGNLDVQCTAIYRVGNVRFCVPETYEERQQAFRKRIEYIARLQELMLVDAPLRRAGLVINQLGQWLGLQEAQKVPNELIASLVGLLPRNVEFARQQSVGSSAQAFDLAQLANSADH